MNLLTDDQMAVATRLLQDYLAAPPNPDGRAPMHLQAERDDRRVVLIQEQLAPLLQEYLNGRVSLEQFKTQNDGINKREEYWGFKGIKGQMFFNMLYNTAADKERLNRELRAVMTVPRDEAAAAEQLRRFAEYVTWLGEQWQSAGESKAGRPKVGSIPFFVSYFWQVQNRIIWPVYYTNSVKVMGKYNLWQPSGEPGADYVAYKQIHEQLAEAFTRKSGKTFDLYWVEHVFWFKGGNPFEEAKPLPDSGAFLSTGASTTSKTAPASVPASVPVVTPAIKALPDSYVPPVIAALPEMARGGEAIRKAAEISGISLEKAFEKYINAAFTVMGYETILLGQGRGRVPDGQAVDAQNSYALLWDAKVRGEGYRLGTDDRTIKEYVTNASRDLDRGRRLRNIYYLVISSEFSDEFDDSIRQLKMETDVSEVCLVEADALVEMVDIRLRSPLEVTLGPDGLQRLFAVSGIITRQHVRECLE
jgi:hypothetical protein